MEVIAKDVNGLMFQTTNQPASSLSAAAVIIEEHLKNRADFDKLDCITVSRKGFIPPDFWNKFPETRPSQYGSRYLVCRKGSKKYEFETWNNTGWAYSNDDITHWAVITPPKD